MLYALIILSIIFFGIMLVNYLGGENTDTQFLAGMAMTFCILGAGICTSITQNKEKKEKISKQQPVDLPEEYMNLSHNSAKPDTVVAFYDNDTVYMEFIPKTHKP